jgi:hypothetical protein
MRGTSKPFVVLVRSSRALEFGDVVPMPTLPVACARALLDMHVCMPAIKAVRRIRSNMECILLIFPD